MDNDAGDVGVLPEDHDQASCSFVVRLWAEEGSRERGSAALRGQITHVDSRRRASIQRLEDIGRFIAPYLEALGVKVGWRWRTKRWLKP